MPKAAKTKVGQDKKVVHPNSRKAVYLVRKATREERVLSSKTASSLKLELLAEKLLWYQERLDPNKKILTKADLASVTKEYLNRFNEELEQIQIVRQVGKRQGNPHSSREDAIKITLEKDKRQLEEGSFEVPNVLNSKQLEFFRAWKGEIKYVKNIKLRKMCMKELEICDEENEMEENESETEQDQM